MNDLGTKTIETERLILRKFEPQDALGMYNNWATDKNTCAKLSWDVHENIDVTKNVIANWISKYDDPYYFNWVVQLKENNEIIGNICIFHVFIYDQICQIGNCYGSKYWGNGYATEAMRAVIKFLLTEVKFRLIEACNYSTNEHCGKLLEKVGMKYDGTLRKRRIDKVKNIVCDVCYYSIAEDEL